MIDLGSWGHWFGEGVEDHEKPTGARLGRPTEECIFVRKNCDMVAP